jgi:hypothetical protein
MTDVEYEGRRLSFAAAGSALTLHAHCVFIATERIHLGSHVMVSEFTWINAGVVTQVGSFVYRANHASIAGGGVCIAGRRSGARIAACGGTRATRSRDSADDLATLAAETAHDDASLILLLRALMEEPDVRAIPFLVGTFDDRAWRVRAVAAEALNFVALHAAERRYLLGKVPGERDPSLSDRRAALLPGRGAEPAARRPQSIPVRSPRVSSRGSAIRAPGDAR